MQWFRLHNKLLNDPVVQGLPPDQFKVYINTLCHASALDKGGYVGTINETSFALRETIENVTSCFIAFHDAGLIVSCETEGETFQIPQWKKKQYESDSSTSRVKKHREKVKRSKTVTVTPPDTDTEQIQIQKQSKTPDKSGGLFDDTHLEMAYQMASPIELRFPKQTINHDVWADSIRKLMELDGYTRQQVEYVWGWIQRHEGNNGFSWATNCRTPGKLREKKDGLSYFEIIKNQIEAERDGKQGNNNGKEDTLDRMQRQGNDTTWAGR